jgi:quinoprotein glucose dehydrogenase
MLRNEVLWATRGLANEVRLRAARIEWQGKPATCLLISEGDTPDAVRNHPALKGLNIPKTGQQGSVGLFVTKTLVVLGDPQVTTTPDHPRGAMLRAYDKGTGQQVGAVWMPAAQSGSPMTYAADGRQFIVVAISGGNYSGEYVAFALPAAATRTTDRGGRQ